MHTSRSEGGIQRAVRHQPCRSGGRRRPHHNDTSVVCQRNRFRQGAGARYGHYTTGGAKTGIHGAVIVHLNDAKIRRAVVGNRHEDLAVGPESHVFDPSADPGQLGNSAACEPAVKCAVDVVANKNRPTRSPGVPAANEYLPVGLHHDGTRRRIVLALTGRHGGGHFSSTAEAGIQRAIGIQAYNTPGIAALTAAGQYLSVSLHRCGDAKTRV